MAAAASAYTLGSLFISNIIIIMITVRSGLRLLPQQANPPGYSHCTLNDDVPLKEEEERNNTDGWSTRRAYGWRSPDGADP